MGYNPHISHSQVGEISHLQTIDPNFLGYPSGRLVSHLVRGKPNSFLIRLPRGDLLTMDTSHLLFGMIFQVQIVPRNIYSHIDNPLTQYRGVWVVIFKGISQRFVQPNEIDLERKWSPQEG